ncbi:MAG TPA: excalibur calcium-binding domain-containing protein [Mycobacteriales bacterium]|nr:excalibur calcium-binding domain-containing protein [Mycobacteriales bacterium]
MTRHVLSATVLATAVVLIGAPPAHAAPNYRNCTELQKTYRHGIGRANARDKTSGRPVTAFRKDTPGYERAMRANSGLDRDRDGIACEKH